MIKQSSEKHPLDTTQYENTAINCVTSFSACFNSHWPERIRKTATGQNDNCVKCVVSLLVIVDFIGAFTVTTTRSRELLTFASKHRFHFVWCSYLLLYFRSSRHQCTESLNFLRWIFSENKHFSVEGMSQAFWQVPQHIVTYILHSLHEFRGFSFTSFSFTRISWNRK